MDKWFVILGVVGVLAIGASAADNELVKIDKSTMSWVTVAPKEFSIEAMIGYNDDPEMMRITINPKAKEKCLSDINGVFVLEYAGKRDTYGRDEQKMQAIRTICVKVVGENVEGKRK